MGLTVLVTNNSPRDRFIPGVNLNIGAGLTKSFAMRSESEVDRLDVLQQGAQDGSLLVSLARRLVLPVEHLGAGVSIGDGTAANARPAYAPMIATTLVAIALQPLAKSPGINDANTCVVKIYNGTLVVKTRTYNTANQPSAPNKPDQFSGLANLLVLPGATLRFDVVQGAAANLAQCLLLVDYTEPYRF